MIFYQTHSDSFSFKLLFYRCIRSNHKFVQCICRIFGGWIRCRRWIRPTTGCQYLVIIVESINLCLWRLVYSSIFIHKITSLSLPGMRVLPPPFLGCSSSRIYLSLSLPVPSCPVKDSFSHYPWDARCYSA